MRRKRTIAVRILRATLLLALLGVVGGLVALYAFGRAGREVSSDLEDSAPADDEGGSGEFAVESRDFHHALVQDDRTIFEIRGARSQRDRDGNVFLQGVVLRSQRPDGAYEVTGDRATYNEQSGEARVEGNVLVGGPRALKVWSEWLELQRGGRLLVASRGTAFAVYDQVVGRSKSLVIDFDEGSITLSHDVQVRTADAIVPRSSLGADWVSIRQNQQLVEARGGVTLTHGASRLNARRLSLTLDESGERVREATALWDVRAAIEPPCAAAPGDAEGVEGVGAEGAEGAGGEPVVACAPSTESSLRVLGHRLDAILDPITGDLLRLSLVGLRSSPAFLRSMAPQTGSRELAARRLDATFLRGLLAGVEAGGSVEFTEHGFLDGRPFENRLAGSAGIAAFDDRGQMVRAALRDGVEFAGGGIDGRGSRVEAHFLTRRMDLTGTPYAEVTTDRGLIRAPEFSFNEATGLLHAIQRVRTTLNDSAALALAAAPMGAGDGPIQVEADEALVRRGTKEFLFRGSVRAWQDKNLLIADQLRGDEAGQTLGASGSVKTLWFPAERPKSSASPTAPAEAAGTGGSVGSRSEGPVEITADLLSYIKDQRVGGLRYEGKVVVQRGGLSISCDLLLVDLDERGEAETLHFQGHVVLTEPGLNRRVEGERAEYAIDPEWIEVFGEPLSVRDGANKMSGYRLHYDLKTGEMLLGAPDTSP